MTGNRGGVLLLATCVLWICSPAICDARGPGSIRRIEVVAPGFAADSPEASAFREGIKAAGYTEGRTVTIDWWFGHGEYSGVEEAVERALRTEPDVLVVESTVAALAAQRSTQTIPVVMALVGDPEGVGLVETLARPGGNITGLTNMSAELAGKRLQLLKQAIPMVKRVGVLWNPTTPMHSIGLAYLKSVAPQLRIDLVPVAVRKSEQFEPAFAALSRSKVDAVMGLDDPFMTLHGGEVIRLAARARLPVAYGWKPLAKEGVLISYAADAVDLFRRAAGYVDKILRGASPATLPVEQPTKFELVVNLRVAKGLGLTIPESLIVQADEVLR
jgi:putative ABC transport system substrate-binding protein